MHLQGRLSIMVEYWPCLDGLSGFSAYAPGQGVLWSSAAVPVVVYAAVYGLCVRIQSSIWGIVCLTHLRNNGEKLPRPLRLQTVLRHHRPAATAPT